jgi:hypothetical protein
LQIKYSDKKLTYTGKELSSLFIFHKFNLQGDALVSFQGECDVKLPEMVDQQDVKANAPIYSPLMLHFLGEFFGDDLKCAVTRQRLLMATILEILQNSAPRIPWKRTGDDIYVKEKKVSVSIATASPVSTLLHTGLNIISKNTPVPAFGLNDAELNPEKMALEILERFQKEMEEIELARCKVKWVK